MLQILQPLWVLQEGDCNGDILLFKANVNINANTKSNKYLFWPSVLFGHLSV